MDPMKEVVELIVSHGIGVACIFYFMYRDYRFMSSMNETLKALEDATNLITEYFIKKGVIVRDDTKHNDN